MRLILLSNSRDPEGHYLQHARDALAELFDGVRRVLFVPFAGVGASWDGYAQMVHDALAPLGITIESVHRAGDMLAAVNDAEAIAVGGGNTFHLLMKLQETALLDAVRARVRGGVPYMGWSAGSVVACPTIRTTNDMPIVEPPRGLAALGLVPFQINAHFTDAHPPGFQGETRRQRLAEFLVANPTLSVVGLPEGDWLAVRDEAAVLGGPHPAYLFRAVGAPTELAPGARVDEAIAHAMRGGASASGTV